MVSKQVGVVAAVCAAVVTAFGATSALGGSPPATGQCPDDFTLLPTSTLASYSVGGIQSADLNGNQMTCIRFLDTPSDIVFMDDVMSRQ